MKSYISKHRLQEFSTWESYLYEHRRQEFSSEEVFLRLSEEEKLRLRPVRPSITNLGSSSESLIVQLQRSNLGGKSEQIDEALRIVMIVEITGCERGDILIVEAVR